jgi:hypothetical protein
MQIIYAAPFLLVAAICFFVCAAVGRFRKQALVLPVGVLSFVVGSIVSYFIFGLVIDKLGFHGPANWFYLIPYVCGGLFVAVICSALYRMIVAILPKWIIAAGLVTATFASSLVFLPFCSWAIAQFARSHNVDEAQMSIVGAVLTFMAIFVSWQILTIAGQFRSDPCFRGITARIFRRPDSARENEPTT